MRMRQNPPLSSNLICYKLDSNKSPFHADFRPVFPIIRPSNPVRNKASHKTQQQRGGDRHIPFAPEQLEVQVPRQLAKPQRAGLQGQLRAGPG